MAKRSKPVALDVSKETSDVTTPAGPSNVMEDVDEEDLEKYAEPLDPEAQFRELFESPPNALVVVKLFRVLPKTHRNEDISGYLEDLPSEVPSYMEYIKHRHGGGYFRLIKYVNKQIKGNKTLNIPACPPRFPDKAVEEQKASSLAGVTVEGLPIDGSDADFAVMLKRIMLMRQYMKALEEPPPPDINNVLLEHFLAEKQQPNLVDQVGQISSVVTSVKQLLPAGGDGGGGDWIGLIGKAIDAFKEAVNAQAQSGKSASPAGNRAGLRGEVAGAPALISSQTEENSAMDQLSEMTLRDKAMAAIQIILQNGLLKPRQDKELIVESIDLALCLTRTERAAIVPYRGALRSMAVAEAGPSFANGDIDREEFEAYLDSVMDLFFDLQRQEVSLG